MRNLATPYGRLSYTAEASNPNAQDGGRNSHGDSARKAPSDGTVVTMTIEDGLRVPSGGIVVALPRAPERLASAAERQPSRATINGRPARLNEAGRIVIHELPANVAIRG